MAMAHAGFAFLAMTKSGSTSLEAAFYEHAMITTRRPPGLKHMSARTFHASIAPLLDRYGYPRETYEVVSVAREPVDRVLSWYRYRTRVGLRGKPGYTGDLPFEAFVEQVVAGEVQVGTTAAFIAHGDPRGLVDRVYRYEHVHDAAAWMAERLGIDVPALPSLNVSPRRDVVVTPAARRRLEEFYAVDLAIHEAAL